MAEVNLTIECLWVKRDGDCSICEACDDQIFSNKYVLVAKIGNEVNDLLQVCESCYESIKDND